MAEDEKWRVVGRRRGPKLRSSSSSSSSHREGATPPVKEGPPLQQAVECDEALLLLKLKRSMARVQDSTFFQRLLLQMRSYPVLDLITRAATTPYPRHRVDHHQVNDVFENQLRDGELVGKAHSSHEDGCSIENTSLSAKSFTSGKVIDIAKACPPSCTHMLQDCECSQNISALRKTCNGRNSDAMLCESESDAISNSKGHADDVERIYKTRALQERTEQWSLAVVLYGLGSIADSDVSRCQLALILLLKQTFSWVGTIEVYDPVLSLSECNVIEGMGCLPLASDEKGRRFITVPTLFYMPHCEEWLYDNVLQANWMPHRLGRIVILGNSFQDYLERWSSPVGRKQAPPSYLLRYQQVAKEVPLEATSSPDLPGFNNMSWHFYDLCGTSLFDGFG